MHFPLRRTLFMLRALSLLLILFVLSVPAYAQDSEETEPVPASSVKLIADARLELLAHHSDGPKNPAPAAGGPVKRTSVTGSIRSVPGYRVIIYSGTDRNKANVAKLDFMRRFPGMRVYMSYAMPQYRVKVGDFTSRGDASGLYHQLNKMYSPCLIVPDIVEINTFHRSNDPANPSKEP